MIFQNIDSLLVFIGAPCTNIELSSTTSKMVVRILCVQYIEENLLWSSPLLEQWGNCSRSVSRLIPLHSKQRIECLRMFQMLQCYIINHHGIIVTRTTMHGRMEAYQWFPHWNLDFHVEFVVFSAVVTLHLKFVPVQFVCQDVSIHQANSIMPN